MNLEGLFRQKLENAEVIPSIQAGDKLMRRLSHREFLRFNPARFNIYYLGAAIGGLIAAGLLLFSDNGKNSEKQHLNPSTGQYSEISIPAGQAIQVEQLTNHQTQNLKQDHIGLSAVEANVISETLRVDSAVKQAPLDASLKERLTMTVPSNSKLQEKSGTGEPLFIPSVISGCAPLKVNFRIAGTFDSYRWNFGNEGYSSNLDPEWIFEREGEYNVTLNAVSNGRTYSYSAMINVFPKPVAGFALSHEKPVIPDEEVAFINYSTNAISYSWNFGDGSSSTSPEPRHRYEEYGNYTVSLRVRSEKGCEDYAVQSDLFSGPEYFIEMPNAFIPNPHGPSGGFYSSKSDESAEIFHPMYSGVVEFHLTVYSKLGMVLFESNDINVGWDGYYKGQLSNPGVYIWKVTGRYRNGVTFNRMGDVTLLRK